MQRQVGIQTILFCAQTGSHLVIGSFSSLHALDNPEFVTASGHKLHDRISSPEFLAYGLLFRTGWPALSHGKKRRNTLPGRNKWTFELSYSRILHPKNSVGMIHASLFPDMEFDSELQRNLKRYVTPLPQAAEESGLDELSRLLAAHQLVLLGEASHGTSEFYRLRARLTKKLIQDHGFGAVAVECDWPDSLQVNQHILSGKYEAPIEEVLGVYERFPDWMWRNEEVAEFVEWLRLHNRSLAEPERCGFYGIDLYSLRSSAHAVIQYLEARDPAAAGRARKRYECFDSFGEDLQLYGMSAVMDAEKSCEDEVIAQLLDLQKRSLDLISRDGAHATDSQFYAEQNARVVAWAERYYRSLYQGSAASWNLRDTHMAHTVHALMEHLQKTRVHHRCVVWAHNSHLGDARATTMSVRGEINLGQLMRQILGKQVANLGFTTYQGTVLAAQGWDAEAEVMQVRPALAGSYEKLFHESGISRFWANFRTGGELRQELSRPRLERAIGVIYRPETERQSHYFEARLPQQFDFVIHLDETHAIHPLGRPLSRPRDGDVPETYPSGQ